MANRAPDEILAEILRPLLKHSDAAFSDTSEKPLLAVGGFEVSSYLLVNKAWLRASTPLLYSVVILRTTAQATALERVLKRYPDIGNYILKLRVEGGFGTAMHTILKCATRLRELFISLVIAASDDVAGLCSGLPLVNPHSVYIHDKNYIGRGNGFSRTPKVDKLLRTVVSLIPKWRNLKLFHFPYFPVYLFGDAVRQVLDPRAEKLVSGLALSQTLETVLLYTGVSVPAYLSQLLSIPTLKTLRFRRGLAYSRYRKQIQNHPELSLYADSPQSEIDATTKAESHRGIQDTHGYYSDPDSDENVILLHAFAPNPANSDDHSTVTEDNLELIQDLGKRCGNTLKSLSAGGAMLYYNNRKKEVQPPCASGRWRAMAHESE
ncbi:hypothetical protein C8F01DRAFT_1175098 [Mycena amicta]|nr:hypothetical protein C8F01DRAFT_1175098 [Mycena amicta]